MAEEVPKSWWQTLPAVLGAIAGLITAITGLLIALSRPVPPEPESRFQEAGVLATTAPEAPPPQGGDGATKPQPKGGVLYVRGVVVPQSVARGEKAAIYVTVTDASNDTVEGVKVIVEAGGGKFLDAETAPYDPQQTLQGPFNAAGITAIDGRFTTWWVCNPCAPNYGIGIRVSKDGYTGAAAELAIPVK